MNTSHLRTTRVGEDNTHDNRRRRMKEYVSFTDYTPVSRKNLCFPTAVALFSCLFSIPFYKKKLRTSAVSSTNFRSILIFASCVVSTCNILHTWYPFIVLASLSRFLPVITQIWGHIAGPSPPSPLRHVVKVLVGY